MAMDCGGFAATIKHRKTAATCRQEEWIRPLPLSARQPGRNEIHMSYAQGDMKDLNRKTVFDLIAQAQTITRVEISEATKSSAPTVLKITNYFLKKQIVSLVGIEETARGRKPQILRFEPDTLLSIGLSIDRQRVTASLINYYGEEKKAIEQESHASYSDIIERECADMIEELVRNVRREYVRSVGISVAGSVDTDNAKVSFGGFSEPKLKREIGQSIRILSDSVCLPVYLFNNVNCAVTGEQVLRKIRNTDLVFLYLGEGIGAGVILDGVLRTGRHFYTGEIGHMVFDPDFHLSLDKPGWMETQLSEASIKKASRTMKGRIDYAARYTSLMIANICNVLDVEQFVVGGEVVDELGNDLIQCTKKYLEHLALFPVVLSEPVSRHSELIGAAFTAMDKEMMTILADN